MPRAAVQETNEPSADHVVADGIVQEATVAAPPEFDKAQMESIISQAMATNLVPMLEALLPEFLKTAQGPTRVTHVQMVEDAPVKPSYLKHYRMDGVISGKYQMIDVSKLNEDGEIEVSARMGADGRWASDYPAILKGRWIHFQNEHFYASTQAEVDFIEYKIKTDPQFRAYEDKSVGNNVTCYVANCGRTFPDAETLTSHLRATHGVE